MSALSKALEATERASVRQRRHALRCRARLYDRRRHLRRLVSLPAAISTLCEPARTRAIIVRLKNALRFSLSLRARRHWAYSPGRHAALLAALGGELLRLRAYSVSSPD